MYDEAEFLAQAPRELTKAAERRAAMPAVVGAVALLLGAAGAFGGLLASAKRHPKGEARGRGAGSEAVTASISHPVRAGYRSRSRQRATRSQSHGRRKLERGKRVSRAAGDRRQAPAVPIPATAVSSAERPIAMSVSRGAAGSSGEFGFER